MSALVPDWAPNIHPLIIHFPIVLLITAVGIHFFLALVIRQTDWLRYTPSILLILGALSVAVAFLTGRQAADSVSLSPAAIPVLSRHADLARWTLWYFVILALVHGGLLWRSLLLRRTVFIALFLFGAAGLFLVYNTAEHGAQLVYQYGVGVKSSGSPEQSAGETTSPVPALVIRADGSWDWTPLAGSGWPAQFNWLEGQSPRLEGAGIGAGETAGLAVQLSGVPTFWVAGDPLTGVQADLALNMDEFEGSAMIVHHVQDAQTYDFLALEEGRIVLGRMAAGKKAVLQQKALTTAGWLRLRAVGEGRHFRGYLEDKLETHGHIDELPPGPVGLRFEGTGTVHLKRFQVVTLKPQS